MHKAVADAHWNDNCEKLSAPLGVQPSSLRLIQFAGMNLRFCHWRSSTHAASELLCKAVNQWHFQSRFFYGILNFKIHMRIFSSPCCHSRATISILSEVTYKLVPRLKPLDRVFLQFKLHVEMISLNDTHTFKCSIHLLVTVEREFHHRMQPSHSAHVRNAIMITFSCARHVSKQQHGAQRER
jgi:hypothetical protein